MDGDRFGSGDQTRDEELVEQGFWPKLKPLARRLPFVEDLLSAYYAAVDPRTPQRVRAVLFGALAYFVLPVDLVPDVAAGLGFTDDAAVLAAAVKTLAAHIRPAHRRRARQTLASLAADSAG
jgi:uncharacterized membrane protein YkvA (DUF1232 family)